MIYIIPGLIGIFLLYVIIYSSIAVLFAKYQKEVPIELGVVLNHRVNKEGRISDVSAIRLEYSAKLFQRGMVKKIFCTGGYEPAREILTSEINSAYLVSIGVPAKYIENLSYSFNTYTNVIEALEKAEELCTNQIVFISSPLHLKRISILIPENERIIKFCAPSFPLYISHVGYSQVFKEIFEESIKVLVLLLPKKLYNKVVLKSLQTGKLRFMRRLSKF